MVYAAIDIHKRISIAAEIGDIARFASRAS
jgi:hypothetical protein